MMDLAASLVAQTSGSNALAVAASTPVEELLDFSGGLTALRRQQVDCWTDMTGPERERVQAKLAWMQRVWAVWQDMKALGKGSLDAAIDQVALDSPDVGGELQHAGKLGRDARTAHNWRNWRNDLTCNARGVPRWERWKALIQDWNRGIRVTPQDEAFWRDAMKLYLRPEAPTLTSCIRDAARVWRGNGYAQDDLPSTRTVQRLTRERVSLSTLERFRGGANVYNARSRGYVKRHCNRPPGQAVFSDHRVSDFWVRMPHPENPEQLIPVRPWCTAICDAKTGYILSIKLYCTAPNHAIIAETMQAALFALDGEPFDIFYTDNGSDFCAAGLATDAVLRASGGQVLSRPDGTPYAYSLLRSLHAEHWLANPYNGKEKPIEGHFGHIAIDFDRTMPGYCGRAPQYRPDPKDTYEGDPRRLCSLQEATQRLGVWTDTVYHQVVLAGGDTRAQAWAARPRRPERQMDERTMFFSLLIPQADTRIVRRTSAGRCGIQFDGWTYSHAELIRHQDKPVMVKTYWSMRRTDRAGRMVQAGVFIFAPNDTFLCVAPAEGICDMFADTAEGKAALGEVQHLINAVSRLDTDTFQAATGLPRLIARDRALALIGEGTGAMPQDGQGGDAVVTMSAGQGAYRRLPAASPSAPPAEPVPEIRTSRANAALLERLLSGREEESAPPAERPRPDAATLALLAEINQEGWR